MPETDLDYLILGQGLAGSLLAWHLLHAGKKVLVLDDRHRSSSSWVAAGLINPLAGMRFNRAPRTEQWLESAHRFYTELGELYGRTYFHPIDMHRLFRSPEQKRFHQRQLDNPASQSYLGKAMSSGDFEPGIRAPHGGFEQTRTGYLDMAQILADLKHWLLDRNAYREQPVDYADIKANGDEVRLGDLKAGNMVFCEGYRLLENPWFRQLPMQPDKGEFLQLSSQRTLCRHIVNGAHMLIPLAEGGYRFGATHEHHQITPAATPEARSQLVRGLDDLLADTQGVHITGQSAGVRPATSDRQPFVGMHPRHPALGVFNGFGARGALSIPWHAKQFAAHLLHQAAVPPEADIARYRDRL